MTGPMIDVPHLLNTGNVRYIEPERKPLGGEPLGKCKHCGDVLREHSLEDDLGTLTSLLGEGNPTTGAGTRERNSGLSGGARNTMCCYAREIPLPHELEEN